MFPRFCFMMICGVLVLPGAGQLAGQETVYVELDGDAGVQIAEVDGARVWEFEGPEVGGKSGQGRSSTVRHVWTIVQDSSLGVIFTEPSGLKLRSKEWALDADIDLVAVDSIIAVRVYMFVFDIWGENRRLYSYDRVLHKNPRQKFDFNPWYRVRGGVPYGSVTWVGRVRLRDGTVRKADHTPALIGIQKGLLDAFTEEELLEYLDEPTPTGDREEPEATQA